MPTDQAELNSEQVLLDPDISITFFFVILSIRRNRRQAYPSDYRLCFAVALRFRSLLNFESNMRSVVSYNSCGTVIDLSDRQFLFVCFGIWTQYGVRL